MTLAHQAPARQDTCRAGAPPCNPATLGPTCTGGCDRRLHPGATVGWRGPCADGHPRNNGHDMCGGCTSRKRRATVANSTCWEPALPRPLDLTWQERAACRGVDPDLFFPEVVAGQSFRARTTAVADRYCTGCPVAAACDRYADATRAVGLWAGSYGTWRGSRFVRVRVIPGRGAAS